MFDGFSKNFGSYRLYENDLQRIRLGGEGEAVGETEGEAEAEGEAEGTGDGEEEREGFAH